jgi:hypothetical protein
MTATDIDVIIQIVVIVVIVVIAVISECGKPRLWD